MDRSTRCANQIRFESVVQSHSLFILVLQYCSFMVLLGHGFVRHQARIIARLPSFKISVLVRYGARQGNNLK